jgi:hypothetical protein
MKDSELLIVVLYGNVLGIQPLAVAPDVETTIFCEKILRMRYFTVTIVIRVGYVYL